MGLLGKVLSIVLTTLLAAGGLAGFLYATDYGVAATVTDKGEDGGGKYVVVTPKIYPTDVKRYLDSQSHAFVCVGYEVDFHVRSRAYQVFDRDGDLVYDSERGLVDAAGAIRCGLLG